MTVRRLTTHSALLAALTLLVVLGSLATLEAPGVAATATVAIQNYAYSPQTVVVTVGSSVTWTNHDAVDHTVTSLSGPSGFDSGQIAPGASYSHRFNVTGTYTYHCADHAMMPTAMVKVLPAAGPSPTPTVHPTTHPTTHSTTQPTIQPSVHVTPSPRLSAHVTTAASAPSLAAKPVASPRSTAKPHPVAPATTSTLVALPSSGGPSGGQSDTALWWIAGVVVLGAGGAAWFLRRRGHLDR